MNLNLTFTALLVGLIACNPTESTRINDRYLALNDSLDWALQAAYDDQAIPGFAVAVVNKDGLIYSKGYGKTGTVVDSTYTAITQQQIASVSKTVLGVAMLKAQELGMLSIDDPIAKYLPFDVKNPLYPEDPILIRHVATHSSSILDTREVFENSYILISDSLDQNEAAFPFFRASSDGISLEEFLVNCLSKEGKWHGENSFFDFKPGTERRYSNLATAVCEYILEQISGQSYAAYTKTHIFDPLGIEDAVWDPKGVRQGTRLYLNDSTVVAAYQMTTKADGGLIISVNGLSLFLRELIKGYRGEGALLSAAGYRTLFKMQEFPDQVSKYGFFNELRPRTFGFEGDAIGHMGGDPGLMTAMYFDPESGLGKIMFINIEPRSEAIRDEVNKIWGALIDHEARIEAFDAVSVTTTSG